MAKDDWFFKFEYSKWDDPELLLCSLETQGFWLRVYIHLKKMCQSSITATVEDLVKVVRGKEAEVIRSILDLKKNNAASVTLRNAQNVTGNTRVTLVSRSLAKDLNGKEKTKLRVQKYRRNARVTLGVTPPLNSKSNKKEVREEELNSSNKVLVGASQATPRSPRGSRLPDPFLLTAEMRGYAAEKRPHVNVVEETEKFVNHFRSAPGQKGVKLDWPATWRNWILNCGNYERSNGSNKTAGTGRRNGGDGGSGTDDFLKSIGARPKPKE